MSATLPQAKASPIKQAVDQHEVVSPRGYVASPRPLEQTDLST